MKAGNLPCRRLRWHYIFLRLAWRRTHENDVSGCCIVRRQSGRRAGAAAKMHSSPEQINRSGSPGLAPGAQLAVLEGDPMASSGDFTYV